MDTFSAVVPDTGEVIEFEGRQLGVLPGKVTGVGWIPPDDLTYEQWFGIGSALQGVNRALMWWIGDWLNYGERRYGETYTQAIEQTGKSENVLQNAKWVAEKYQSSTRVEGLSWSHHREAAGLPEKERADVLKRARAEGWTSRDVKTEVNRRKAAVAIGAPHANDDTCKVADLDALVQRGLRFGTIYADPPWLYDNQGTRAATGNHYGGMTVEELCELPIRGLAADASHLHLWTTNAFLFDCPRIFDAWGFEFRTSFVWVKNQMGIGNYWRNSHEIMLTAVRGDAKRFNDHSMVSWMEGGAALKSDRGRHSAKPEQVRHLIERASPGPYLELFGRSPADGWTVWGNQIECGLFHANVREIA